MIIIIIVSTQVSLIYCISYLHCQVIEEVELIEALVADIWYI